MVNNFEDGSQNESNVTEVTDAYLNATELLVTLCHKYDIARDDQLALHRAIFKLNQKENK